MSCNNCFDNCAGTPVSDKCVKYTGETISILGITQGDSLYSVEAVILQKLQDALSGTGIVLSDIESCDFLISILAGKDPSLANIIQMLVTASCTLKELVADIQEEISGTTTFNTSCLTLGSSPTKDDILQATITKLCSVSSDVTTIKNDYVKASQLCSLVTSCISGSASAQEYTKMSKYVAYPYHGPTSVFDSSGNGLASSGYSKVYMCLGQTVNGFTLPDYRGRSPLGANSGVPNTNIDTVVNPALPANAAYAVSNKQKKGGFSDTLITSQIPSHTHSVTDPGHDHTLGGSFQAVGDDNNSNPLISGGNAKTGKSTTGITIASTGGNQPHNTLHPVVGAIFIMYVP